MKTEMLYIDPDTCIDCGACVSECPVDAIFADDDLDENTTPFLDINAAYYLKYPTQEGGTMPPRPARRDFDFSGLRVAVIGSGPAASYAAAELLAYRGVRVNMFDRLLAPYGLIRSGVAPDHVGTKAVTDVFRATGTSKEFELHLGVEVGKHVSHSELLAHHHAIIYATGASEDRKLGIPGEDLAGSHAAMEFVAWYNGHPDHSDRSFDLSGERALIVGNGNVALDVARILVSDVDELDKTDIADHAVAAFRHSNIREVVVLGRRGPAQAAYTSPEFLGLGNLPNVDILIDSREAVLDPYTQKLIDDEDAEPAVRIKSDLAAQFAARQTGNAPKRIVFRYFGSPIEIAGEQAVTGVKVVRNLPVPADRGVAVVPTDKVETIEASLVLRSIGYQGSPMAEVPFDYDRGTIPNRNGRVIDTSSTEPVVGVYAAGWIKRGPSGVIGTNKRCAAETVGHLLDDYETGLLATPTHSQDELMDLIHERQPATVNFTGWQKIDRAEKAAGIARNRTRVKFIDVDSMLAVVRASE
jgi:ferredoxin--NADP+ reductase